ncbi:hypothetical protein [Paractinoplanes atraurantiacus]|uniref:hypothetical protein n=1 Tax=Paractinoplanes atraurantiacus TaxID=1036182 RepID=UPI0015CEFBE0|nr:hypothetical protein [Actinoplanes atraurantiacus]
MAELIPQVFFDILARYVPGLVLFGSWILLLGQDEWRALLSTVVGGRLDDGNALPAATLVLLFVPFVAGYVIAPLAKIVQRCNERGWSLPPLPSRAVYEDGGQKWRPKYWWVLNDKDAGKGYDWLRRNAPEAGALSAKIRAEFTMHNALAVAFLAIAVMAVVAREWGWAVASALTAPLMAYRGATTEKTYFGTTRKLCANSPSPAITLKPPPRLIWLIPGDKREYPLWEDGKGWLDVRELRPSLKHEHVLSDVADWAPGKARPYRDGRKLARELEHEAEPAFVFLVPGSFWRLKR